MSAPEPTVTAPPGLGGRVAASIVAVFGWLIFILLFFAFWASSFTGLQSGVIVVVSVLFFLMAMGANWASWGLHHHGVPQDRSRAY